MSPFILSAALIESVLLWVFIVLQHVERQFATQDRFTVLLLGYFHAEGYYMKIKPLL